jgi:hypothetical protein
MHEDPVEKVVNEIIDKAVSEDNEAIVAKC